MSIAGLRFLVTEDHDVQRRALVMALGRLGATIVHEAADGYGALKILGDPARPVDIVITDLDMPGMDGMEFVRHLGESGDSISIILASALEYKLLASIATMSEAYGIKLLGIVEKPLTPENLMMLIKLHDPAQVRLHRAAAPTFSLEEIAAGLRSDEFEPFFQPKIELTTGQVKGVEALARWRHTQPGLIAPYAFIRPLEENGLIDDLTWIMLRKAAACCSAWRATGLDATVSVNLSVKSLVDVTIADRVTELVRAMCCNRPRPFAA